MLRIASMMVLGATALLSIGCQDAPPSEEEVQGSQADPERRSDEEPAPDEGSDDKTPTSTLSGHVKDAAGNPLQEYRIQACFRACRIQFSGSDGTYSFSPIEDGTHLLELWSPGNSADAGELLSPTFPVTLEAGQTRTLDLRWAAADKRVQVPEQHTEIEVANGLFLTIGKDTSTPSFLDVNPYTDVYGFQFPADALPPIEGAGAPLGLWVLGPTKTTAAAAGGFPVGFTNSWGLPDGSTLHVWFAEQDPDTLAGRWTPVGDVTVQGSQARGSAAIRELGTVLLTE